MPYFVLDMQYKVIQVDSKKEWNDFIEYEYPSIVLPIHRQKDVVIYIDFYGIVRNNLFQIVIRDRFGNLINWTNKDLDTYDDALKLFNEIVEKYI